MTLVRCGLTVVGMIPFYLKKRPLLSNLVTGVSSSTSMLASEGRAYEFASDAEAVRNDWLIVGDDIRKAMKLWRPIPPEPSED